MAYCDVCCNFDRTFRGADGSTSPSYQPDLYYYWDAPLEEDYDWRDSFPDVDCMCEICFDINNSEGKITWKDGKNPFDMPVEQVSQQLFHSVQKWTNV